MVQATITSALSNISNDGTEVVLTNTMSKESSSFVVEEPVQAPVVDEPVEDGRDEAPQIMTAPSSKSMSSKKSAAYSVRSFASKKKNKAVPMKPETMAEIMPSPSDVSKAASVKTAQSSKSVNTMQSSKSVKSVQTAKSTHSAKSTHTAKSMHTQKSVAAPVEEPVAVEEPAEPAAEEPIAAEELVAPVEELAAEEVVEDDVVSTVSSKKSMRSVKSLASRISLRKISSSVSRASKKAE